MSIGIPTKISTSLRDPLGCSDLSEIFFGSSPAATQWDKIVAEICHTTFVFLGHPVANMIFFMKSFYLVLTQYLCTPQPGPHPSTEASMAGITSIRLILSMTSIVIVILSVAECLTTCPHSACHHNTNNQGCDNNNYVA